MEIHIFSIDFCSSNPCAATVYAYRFSQLLASVRTIVYTMNVYISKRSYAQWRNPHPLFLSPTARLSVYDPRRSNHIAGRIRSSQHFKIHCMRSICFRQMLFVSYRTGITLRSSHRYTTGSSEFGSASRSSLQTGHCPKPANLSLIPAFHRCPCSQRHHTVRVASARTFFGRSGKFPPLSHSCNRSSLPFSIQY